MNIYQISFTFSDLKYKVKNWFFPQHSTLRKSIPNTWMDLDGIIENFLDAAIISYVEDEDGLYPSINHIEESENLTDEEYNRQWGGKEYFLSYKESRYNDYLLLRKIYDWVKKDRAEFQRLSDIYLDKEDHKMYTQVEDYIIAQNTYYYTQLVKLRGHLWT